ncbi:hypothetical protein BSKO_01320 [Bryopsis sp. KO-2023]|nr:hypothetical protein BSKO_01320 [Bryopsis sp. KO-2023]
MPKFRRRFLRAARWLVGGCGRGASRRGNKKTVVVTADEFDWLEECTTPVAGDFVMEPESQSRRLSHSQPSFSLGYPTDSSSTPRPGRASLQFNPVYDFLDSTPVNKLRSPHTPGASPRGKRCPMGDLFLSYDEERGVQGDAETAGKEAGVENVVTPAWNRKRPYLTGSFLWEDTEGDSEDSQATRPPKGNDKAIVPVAPTVELTVSTPRMISEISVLDDLLYGFMGLGGQHVSFEFPHNASGGKEVVCILGEGLEPGLHASVCRALPVCEYVVTLQQFVETRLIMECGMVCHAVASFMRQVLDDWMLLVTQLETLLMTGRLTMQSLWHYVNPPFGWLKLLASIARRAASSRLMGSRLLNLIYTELRTYTGDRDAHFVLRKLLEAASIPYFEIMEKWLCEGVLDDPYDEFIVQENPKVSITATTTDLQSAYWRHRYTIRHVSTPQDEDYGMPAFLEEHEEMILTTGKYLNAIQECGRPVQRPLANDEHIEYDSGNRFVQYFHKAHEVATRTLLDFFMKDLNLLQWLKGIKHFFLLDQGDMIGNLMDIAEEEFAKPPGMVSHTRMQSLLELAIRTSSVPQGTDSAALAFGFDSRSLLEMARAVFQRRSPESTSIRGRRTEEEKSRMRNRSEALKGFQVFALSYRVDWPMTLVVPPKHMQQYQLLFKHLFLLRKVERDLGKVWQVLQALRRLDADRAIGARSKGVSLLCHKMMHTFQQYIRYLTVETVEQSWHVLETELAKSKDVDSVIEIHKDFITKVLKHSMLCKAKVVSLFEKLEQHALDFVELVFSAIKSENAGQQLTSRDNPPVGVADTGNPSTSSSDAVINAAISNEDFNCTIQKIDMLFTHNVNELIRQLTEVYESSTSDRGEGAAVRMETGEEIVKLLSLIQRLSLSG